MDLNADVVLSDPSDDGVNLSEPVELDDMGLEVGDGGTNEGLEGKGPKGELVNIVEDSEVKIGSLDRDTEEKGSVVSSHVGINGGEGREGLEGAQFGAGGDGIAANNKGLVLESEDTFRTVESSFSFEKDRGKDEILRECAESEIVSAVDGDEAKLNAAVHETDDSMRDDKKEDVALVAEIAYVEKERGQNVEQCQAGEQSLDASSSMQDNVKLESLGTTGSVGQVTDDIVAVDQKVVNHNESLHHKDLNLSSHSEMLTSDGLENQALEVDVEVQTNENKLTCDDAPWVSKNTEKGPNLSSMVIDSNPSMRTDGNVSMDVNGNSTSSELEFHGSDLVWGKVRSHPWWPGQICDPSASSEKANKYFKKGTYLIAYFWDQTFAWNEAPKIKPFLKHFSQMEKQSDIEEFQDAIACALDEVSRRIEFGLACSCISKDVYSKLKTQIISNAGIREEASRRDGGDSSLSAASFEPVKLIRFIKEMAQFPYSRADRLELVTSRAQLSAFYRWKGYSQLPEFNMLGGLLDDADILLLEKKHNGEVTENALPVIKDDDLMEKSKSTDNSSRKRKHISGDSTHPSKKEKSLSDVVAEKYLSTSTSENGSEGKSGCNLISQSSCKKRKAVDSFAGDSAVKQWRSDSSTGPDSNSLQNKQAFRVGDRICRVASQLSGSSPILKNYNATSTEGAVQDKGKVKTVSEKAQTEKLAGREYPSPDEMLSQLYLAAINPMNGYSFLTSTITCFSEFRNTICLNCPGPEEHQLSLNQLFGGKLGKKSARTGKKSISSGITEKSETEAIPHEQPSLKNQNENGKLVPGAPTDKDTSTVEQQSSLELNPNLDSEQKIGGGDLDLETSKPALHMNESCEKDLSPTALILKFTDLESVPSEANLKKIFSCFGPLTEVLRKSSRATVVFRRRSDAETAFSSTGKYSTFGPSLVSYRLKFLPPTPSKVSPSPNATKRGRKPATSLEGNAAN